MKLLSFITLYLFGFVSSSTFGNTHINHKPDPSFWFFSINKEATKPVTRLDSSINNRWDKNLQKIMPIERMVYSYTLQEKASQINYYTYGLEQNTWLPYKREKFSYDSNNYNTLFVQYAWDNEKEEWQPQKKEESDYDSEGNLLKDVSYGLIPLDKLQANSLSEDISGLNFSSITWGYNKQVNKSVLIEAETIVYDSLGNIINSETYERNKLNIEELNYRLIPENKREFIYNSNGNSISDAHFDWDVEKNIWVMTQRNERALDSKGRDTLSDVFLLNNRTKIWEHENRWETKYDSSGDMIFKLNYDFNWEKNKIEKSSKMIKNNYSDESYDMTTYMWIDKSNNWLETEKEEYVKDSCFLCDTRTLYSWDIYYNKWMVYEKEVYEFDTLTNTSISQSFQRDMLNQQLFAYKMKITNHGDNKSDSSIYITYNRERASYPWTVAEKSIYVVDTRGNTIEEIIIINKIDAFNREKEYNRETFVFDEQNRKTGSTAYYWNDLRQGWKAYKKEEYLLNNFGDITDKKVFAQNENIKEWILVEHNIYYLSELNNKLQ